MYTHTPIVPYIKVQQEGESILETIDNTEVVLISVEWTCTLNYISECSIELSYGTQAGKALVESIFPDVNKGKPYSTIEVYIKGFDTPVSRIKEDKLVFKGIIYSYGETLSYGNINYVIHARETISVFTMIPVFAPGFHASTPYNFGIESMGNASSGGSIQQLFYFAMTEMEAYEVFKKILEEYTKQITKYTPSNRADLGDIFKMAVDSFQLGSETESPILKEYNEIQKVGNQTLLEYPGIDKADNMFAPMVHQLVSQFLSNPTLTFWDFMMNFFNIFGLDLVGVNGKKYIMVRSSLDKAIANIPKSDIINLSSYKVPFGIPTRCVLMGYTLMATTQTLNNDFILSYPPASEGVQDIEKNGIYTIFHQAPSYLRNFVGSTKISQKDTNTSKKGTDSVEENIQNAKKETAEKKDTLTEVHNNYAKYVLMCERLKNRTLNLVLQLSLDLVPGVPYFIELPNKSQQFEETDKGEQKGLRGVYGVVAKVSHSISAATNSAITNIAVDHIRYPNEIEGDAFPNPLYPDFSIDSVKEAILGEKKDE